MKRIDLWLLTLLAPLTLFVAQTNAGLITYTFEQVENDVVMNIHGSFNTTGLSGTPAGTNDGNGFFASGLSAGVLSRRNFTYYLINLTFNPVAFPFGSGRFFTQASLGDTFAFGIQSLSTGFVYLASDYQSGASLSATATFVDTTLAQMGLTVGKTASFSYSAGSALGTVNLQVLAAVPEPSALWLVGSVIGTELVRRRRRWAASVAEPVSAASGTA